MSCVGRRVVKMRVLSWFAACLVVVLWACFFIPSVSAEANFQTTAVSGLTSAYHIVSADFNNDTIPDLAVTQWSANQVTILLGNGLGGFTAGATLTTGVHPNFIATGNLNGAGGIDLAVTNGGGDRDVTLFFNDGTGTSWSTSTLNIGSDADVSSVVAASLTSNADTNVDLFIVKDSGVVADFYEVWNGDGAGLFTEITGASGGTGNLPIFAASVDLNVDGRPDMVISNYLDNTITILLGNGDGTFSQASGSPVSVEANPRSIATGNLNGDAHVDLVVVNSGGNSVTILLGNGDGTFTGGGSFSVSGVPASAAIADFDSDGFKDIALTRWSANTVSIYYGNGDGTFRAIPTDTPVGTNPMFIVADDLDKDGNTDLAVTNYGSNNVTILVNRTGVCIEPGLGLIAWWSGDGHPFDLVGTNNGTMMNGGTYAPGRVGRAFSFDGTNDHVQVLSPVNLPLGDAPRSIDVWFRTPRNLSISTESSIVQYGTENDGQMFGLITSANAAGRLYFYGHNSDIAGTTTIQPNTWYHGAVTYDGSTLRLYVNGQLEGSAPMTLNTTLTGSGITIGYRPGGSSWEGLIDEVNLYDRSLTAEEIANIYNRGEAGKCKPCFTPPLGLASWWTGDGNANDISGVNNGTINGATFGAGKVEQAFSLDGTNDYVDLPDAASDQLSNTTGTITVWVNPTTIGDNDIVVAFGSGNDGQGIGIGIFGNVRIYHHTGTYDWQSLTPVNANEWTMLTYSWDSTTERIYKNGIFSESRARNFSYGAGHARIGHGFWGDSANAFPGLIDEVQIFNRTLSAEEIAAIHDAGTAGICIPSDTTPDQFTLDDQTGVTLNTLVESNEITIAGINSPADISITGGEYSINGGAYTSESGTVDNSQAVRVRQTSSSSYSTTTSATLTIGGVSDAFSVTTIPQYLLTVTRAGTGEGMVTPSTGSLTWTGNIGSGSYGSGTMVTLTARVSAGSAFEGFTGCDTASGSTCEVVMTSARNVTASFRAVSAVRLLSPEGGVPLPTGSPHTIQWEAPVHVTKFSLKYSTDGGVTWKPVVSGTVNGLTYDWTVPLQTKNRKACLIKVIGYDENSKKIGSDVSDSFAIEVIQLNSPNGKEELLSGNAFPVEWTTNIPIRPVASVTILYSTDNGITWKPAGVTHLNPGSFDWTPSVLKAKTKCKVKVILKDEHGVSLGNDVSEAVFTINAGK